MLVAFVVLCILHGCKVCAGCIGCAVSILHGYKGYAGCIIVKVVVALVDNVLFIAWL